MLTKRIRSTGLFLLVLFIVSACSEEETNTVHIYLAGDSTMADYSDNYDPGKDYYATRYPVTGWGQVFQEHFIQGETEEFTQLFDADSVVVVDRARGGRSTRTFFQEGRWRSIVDDLEPGDLVLIQFGHNDASVNKTERYVDLEGYKEFLRLFVGQTRDKHAIPIILTPVARNYPWVDGKLENVHGDYPDAAFEVAQELDVHLIDLNRLSMEAFSRKGKEYVSENYFMNLPAEKYEAYPEGCSDNTHFQPEGARVISELVYEAMKNLSQE